MAFLKNATRTDKVMNMASPNNTTYAITQIRNTNCVQEENKAQEKKAKWRRQPSRR